MKGKRVLKRQRNNDGLLGTYFASLFSVMLCLVMLFGTTFAWFYTNDTSVGNEIHSGILKADMRHDGVSLAERPEHPVFSSGEKWTPGREQTETVEVLNTGNVPVDYKLDFVPVGEKSFNKQTAALFTVYVQADGSRTKIGTLDQLMDNEQELYLTVGQELGPDESRAIRITLEMAQAVSYSVMGQIVPVYLKLEAYQHLAGTSG